jgi:predicted DNA-binding mobile mystery protein A
MISIGVFNPMQPNLRRLLCEGLDQRLPALASAKLASQKPARGWLRAIREAIGLKQVAVAKSIGVTPASYRDLESSEARGTITLSSLNRAAEAMDCEIVYFIVPRPGAAKSFAELALRFDPEFKHLQASEHSMALEGQAVGDLPSSSTSR